MSSDDNWGAQQPEVPEDNDQKTGSQQPKSNNQDQTDTPSESLQRKGRGGRSKEPKQETPKQDENEESDDSLSKEVEHKSKSPETKEAGDPLNNSNNSWDDSNKGDKQPAKRQGRGRGKKQAQPDEPSLTIPQTDTPATTQLVADTSTWADQAEKQPDKEEQPKARGNRGNRGNRNEDENDDNPRRGNRGNEEQGGRRGNRDGDGGRGNRDGDGGRGNRDGDGGGYRRFNNDRDEGSYRGRGRGRGGYQGGRDTRNNEDGRGGYQGGRDTRNNEDGGGQERRYGRNQYNNRGGNDQEDRGNRNRNYNSDRNYNNNRNQEEGGQDRRRNQYGNNRNYNQDRDRNKDYNNGSQNRNKDAGNGQGNTRDYSNRYDNTAHNDSQQGPQISNNYINPDLVQPRVQLLPKKFEVKPSGRKSWPEMSINILESKLSITYRKIDEHVADLMVVPYFNMKLSLYPGFIVNRCKVDYKKKIMAKQANQVPGSVYIQKCLGIQNFDAFAFVRVGKSESNKSDLATVKIGMEQVLKAALAIKIDVNSLLIPYSKNLCDADPLLQWLIEALDAKKHEAQNKKIKEIVVTTNNKEDFMELSTKFQNIIFNLMDENQVTIG